MAGWNPRPEKYGLIANSKERPGDVFVPALHNGKPCAADVAITHALQPTYINYAAKVTAGAATQYAIKVKDHKYKEVLSKQDVGIDFLPLVADCFGAWDPRAITFFKRIASSIAKRSVRPYSEVISQLMEKISVCLMRANASALLKRRPKLALSDVQSQPPTARANAIYFLQNNF
jgi:hypothetical protein